MLPDPSPRPNASQQPLKKVRRNRVPLRLYHDNQGSHTRMNIANFLQKYQRAGLRDPAAVSNRTLRMLAAERLGISEAAVMAFPERELSQPQWRALCADAEALASGMPSAYVFGTLPFLNETFKVDRRALIPRPETEALCARILEILHEEIHPTSILDMCCGSGVMGLSLGRALPDARISLSDISAEALDLCAENCARLGLRERASLYLGDLWRALDREPDSRFDLIVANPPYVARTDRLESGVREHEPALALFSEDRGMAHIKRILHELPQHLTLRGQAIFELGHEHASTLSPWLDEHFGQDAYHWENDPFGVPRYLFFERGLAIFTPGQQGRSPWSD